jgi:AsmA family protein
MRPVLKWTGIVVVAVLAAIVICLALFDWNRLREPIARMASERSGRPVQIVGDLKVHAFSLNPSVSVDGLRVGNPNWVREDVKNATDHLAEIQHLRLKIALLHLLKGDLVLPELVVQKPDIYIVRARDGRGNWQGKKRPTAAPAEDPAELPAIRKLIISGGTLHVIDEIRKLEFRGTFASDDKTATDKAMPFHLQADGKLNEEPFALRVEGRSLININPETPYPFTANVQGGETKLIVQGVFTRPFDLGQYRASAILKGDDLADLYGLTGLALPNTPPYRVSGRLERKGSHIQFTEASGEIGDSDVRGDVFVDIADERPRVKAQLVSRALDVDDLAAPLGAAPSVKSGETVSKKEQQIAAAMQAKRKLFPDATLHIDRIRGMDGTMTFRADSVVARKVPLRKFSANLKLEKGVLLIDPLSFEMPQGRLAGSVRLDARKDIPETNMDLHLTGVQLSQFKPKKSPVAPLDGVLLARAQAKGRGDSVAKVLATADGAVTAVVPKGEIREAFAELTGINVARGLGLLVTKDQEHVDVRCGVADFKIINGKMSAQNLIFDTNNVLITGKGAIDLGAEAFDLTVRGQPKKLRLLRVRTPIEINGPLRKPNIGVKPGNLAGQTGVAAALGALVTPLAAVFAFVDPGLAHDADCGALLAEAQRNAAPVKRAPIKTATGEATTRR